MTGHTRKLLTVVTEAIIERDVTAVVRTLGARGFTATDCRGEGSRGVRDGQGELGRNVRIEVVCDAATAERITEELHARFYADYGMITFISDVSVLRPSKFSAK